MSRSKIGIMFTHNVHNLKDYFFKFSIFTNDRYTWPLKKSLRSYSQNSNYSKHPLWASR